MNCGVQKYADVNKMALGLDNSQCVEVSCALADKMLVLIR